MAGEGIVLAPEGSSAGLLVTEDTHIEWNGMLFGVDTWIGYKSLVGWDDLPGVSNNNAPNPRAHGYRPGSQFANSRIVTFQGQMWGGVEFAELRRELLKRTQIEQVERPLVIRQHGQTLVAWGRIIARSIPIDRKYMQGYPIVSLQWECSDSRRYEGLVASEVSIPVPSAVGGLEWDTGLDWLTGLNWGTTVSGSATITNTGTTDTPAIISFNGPLNGPYHLTNVGHWRLGFDLNLAAGEVLEVDTRLGSATLAGSNRLFDLSTSSDLPEDCLLVQGDNDLMFNSDDTNDTGFVTIAYQPAHM